MSTFLHDKIYTERAIVVASLAHLLWKTEKADIYKAMHEGDWDDDWRTILVIAPYTLNPSHRQISWHFHDAHKCLLETFPQKDNYIFDGHNTEEKYIRLLRFCLGDLFLNTYPDFLKDFR